MFKIAAALSLLPIVALATPQYGAPPPSDPSSTSSSAAAAPSAPPSTSGQINVDVGADGNFVFNPANITAANGTLVTFFFPAGDTPHSVTQGDFANPCNPLQASGSDPAGFDSGLQLSKQFTLNITNDQIPVYFFCKAPLHCGMGMVGSINAPSSGNTFEAWQAAATKVGANEANLVDNGPATGGVGAIATAAPSAGSDSGTGGSGGTPGAGVRVEASSMIATILGLAAAMFIGA